MLPSAGRKISPPIAIDRYLVWIVMAPKTQSLGPRISTGRITCEIEWTDRRGGSSVSTIRLALSSRFSF